jgi:signal transduction histidine kinase/ligand-binding sensor domain-containing protein
LWNFYSVGGFSFSIAGSLVKVLYDYSYMALRFSVVWKQRVARTLSLLVLSTAVVPLVSRTAELPQVGRHVCQSIGEGSGLGTQTVVSLIQDAQGFLWLGTLDGVFRYDGNNVDHFGPSEGLASSLCLQLLTDASGAVWASMRGGASRFDGAKFVPVTLPLPKEENVRATPRAQQFAFGRDGSLLVASSAGLWQFPAPRGDSPRPSRIWTTEQGLPSDDIDAVYVSADGLVWLSAAGVLATIEPDSGKLAFPYGKDRFSEELVLTIHVTYEGHVWARCQNHLWRAPKGTTHLSKSNARLPSASFFFGSPTLDRSERYLLPTASGLFYEESNDEWSKLGEENGLPSAMALSALEDHEGAYWIGLGGGGVARCPNLTSTRSWTAQDGLPDNVVWNVLRDRKARLWVATGAGIGLWTPGAERWVTLKDGIADNVITMLEADERAIWFIASRVGIGRVDLESLEVTQVSLPPLCRETPVSLELMPSGEVWTGGVNCLLALRAVEDRVEVRSVPRPEHAAGCTRTLNLSKDGVLWTGGPDGVCRFDGRSWEHYLSSKDERHIRADSLRAVSGDELWLTNRDFQGVTHLQRKEGKIEIRDYSSQDGLPSDSLGLIGLDAEGRLWAGGTSGMAIFEGNKIARVFNRSDGLIWDDVSGEAFLGEPDGTVFIGTSRGLTSYDPRRIFDTHDKVPTIVVRKVVGGGGESRVHDDSPISLQPDKRSVGVELSCLTFRQPEAVLYSFRLNGLESEDTVSNLPLARYPSLPPGSYEFTAHCRSAAGVWSEQIRSLRVVALPSWWQTWQFRFACVLGFIGLVFGAFYVRIRLLKLRNVALEAKVRERTASLEQAHARILQLEKEAVEKQMAGGFAHEMRNALSGAKILVGRILNPDAVDEQPESLLSRSSKALLGMLQLMKSEIAPEALGKVGAFVKEIHENNKQVERLNQRALGSINRSLEVTGAIMDYARIAAQKPGDEEIAVKELCRQILAEELNRVSSRDIELLLDIDDGLEIIGNRSHFGSILGHLVRNAMDAVFLGRSGDAEKEIRVSAKLEEQELHLRIWDSGVGIAPSNLPRVFEPFYSTKPATGLGLGLGIAQKYLSLYEGHLELTSEWGSWSCALIRLPRRFVKERPSGQRPDIGTRAS